MPFIDYKSDEGHADIIVAHNQIFGKKERKKQNNEQSLKTALFF